MPMFVGVFFTYLVIHVADEKKRFYVYLALIYLSIYDLDKGFYLFSSIFVFVIFYYLFMEKIKHYFACGSCILLIYVSVAYLGHYIFNTFISYLLYEETPMFSFVYFYYIAIDFIVSMILFKGKS